MSEPPEPTTFIAPEPAELAALFPAYVIEELIAVGGMGAVYRAIQKSLDRTVAIKILPMELTGDIEFRTGFEAEAKAMARLNDPNLIGVFDFGEVNGMLYIVMEYVSGESLFHAAHSIAIDPTEVIRLVSGICTGLAHAHNNGILHRDIKPSNILLTQEGAPKIGDFGLARPIEVKTQQGEVIFGTPGYTAPEVISAPQTVDHRADIFSVGVLLHELLTGKLPADDTRPASAIVRCDARFDAIIRRATAPIPTARYASATMITAELQTLLVPVAGAGGIKQVGAIKHPPPPRRAVTNAPAPRKKKQSSGMAALCLLTLLAAGAYYYVIKQGKNPMLLISAPVVQVPPAASVPSHGGVPTTPEATRPKQTGLEISDDPDSKAHVAAKPEKTAELDPATGIPKDAVSYHGKSYYVYLEKCSWHEARDRCHRAGGQLVVIHDAATQAFVKSLAKENRVWLGATDELNEGHWLWVDGSEMTYTAFGTKEANHGKNEDHYLRMQLTESLWKRDKNKTNTSGYVCEWSGKSNTGTDGGLAIDRHQETLTPGLTNPDTVSPLPSIDPAASRIWKDAATGRTFEGTLKSKSSDNAKIKVTKADGLKTVVDLETARLSGEDQDYVKNWTSPDSSASSGNTEHPRGIVLGPQNSLPPSQAGNSRVLGELGEIFANYGVAENDLAEHADSLIYEGPPLDAKGGDKCRITYLMPRAKAVSLLLSHPASVIMTKCKTPGFPPGLVFYNYDIRSGDFDRMSIMVDAADQVVSLRFRAPYSKVNLARPYLSSGNMGTRDFFDLADGSAIYQVRGPKDDSDNFIVNSISTSGTYSWFAPVPLVKQILFNVRERKKSRN